MGILPQCGYSIFGIGVDRRQEAKWLFAQQKATLQAPQKVYVYSENALELRQPPQGVSVALNHVFGDLLALGNFRVAGGFVWCFFPLLAGPIGFSLRFILQLHKLYLNVPRRRLQTASNWG